LIPRAGLYLLVFKTSRDDLFADKNAGQVGHEKKNARKLLKIWSHPPGSNRRPADYETDDLPLSCSVSVVIRRLLPLLALLLGGFWMGNWMGKRPAFAEPPRSSDMYELMFYACRNTDALPVAAVNANVARRPRRVSQLETHWRAA